MTKDQQLTDWLAALDAGELTAEQVRSLLIEMGTDPAYAAEILFIHGGGSDVIELSPPEP